MNFIPGLELNKKYYFDVVKPILAEFDKKMIYSAALIGYGSDVIGYDNDTSMDHNWGPRLQIFLDSEYFNKKDDISEFLSHKLPYSFMGFPTNFTAPAIDGTQSMLEIDNGKVRHLIDIFDINSYVDSHNEGQNIHESSEQVLLEVISGEVFHDGLNKLISYRKKLAYFSEQKRVKKLINYWSKISEEEAFIGRAVEMNDFIGLKLISARIVKYLLKICFVLKRKYVPYSKWFATVFKDLGFNDVQNSVEDLLSENNSKEVEDKLSKLYLLIIEKHNSYNELPIIDNKIVNYYGRPYKVIKADKIVELLEK